MNGIQFALLLVLFAITLADYPKDGYGRFGLNYSAQACVFRKTGPTAQLSAAKFPEKQSEE